jgi:hypothetical protein
MKQILIIEGTKLSNDIFFEDNPILLLKTIKQI